MTYRELLILNGAIKPLAKRKILRLDDVGREIAIQHIAEDAQNARDGYLSEVPDNQVPDYVLAYWGDKADVIIERSFK